MLKAPKVKSTACEYVPLGLRLGNQLSVILFECVFVKRIHNLSCSPSLHQTCLPVVCTSWRMNTSKTSWHLRVKGEWPWLQRKCNKVHLLKDCTQVHIWCTRPSLHGWCSASSATRCGTTPFSTPMTHIACSLLVYQICHGGDTDGHPGNKYFKVWPTVLEYHAKFQDHWKATFHFGWNQLNVRRPALTVDGQNQPR